MNLTLGLDGIQEFENTVKKICDFAFVYGFQSIPEFDPMTASAEEGKAFTKKCHEGFGNAQQLIIEEMLKIQTSIREHKVHLKAARSAKDMEQIHGFETTISYLQHRECILRKIADALAWQLFGLQRWNLKRLFLGKQMPQLDSSNIRSVLEAIKQINQDPLSFGLISDITSFVQVGDILAIDRSLDNPLVRIIELKEGKMNEKVMDFLQEFDKIKCLRIPYFFAQEHGKDALKQAKRITSQQIRGAQVQQFINTGKGKDIISGEEILMPEEIFEEKHYDEELIELIGKCKTEGRAIGLIDECLYVGVYDPTFYPAYLSDFINYLLLESKNKNGNRKSFESSEEAHMIETFEFLEKVSPIYDLRLNLTTPSSRPMFLRFLPSESILNIIFGKMTILLCLDYNKWFARATKYRINGRWATEEEMKSQKNDRELLKIHDQIPVLEKNGTILFLGDGTLMQIIDGTTPDSILEVTSQGIDNITISKK
jgi:hypothetical protein